VVFVEVVFVEEPCTTQVLEVSSMGGAVERY
jgi:hypothetical protein